VAPDVVLTAAHCVSGDESDGEPDTFPAAQFRVLAGTKVRSQGGERIQAVEIREHPNYDGDANSGHDVALIKLERSSTLGRPIRIAGAADAAFFAAGKQSVVTGWGANVFRSGRRPTASRRSRSRSAATPSAGRPRPSPTTPRRSCARARPRAARTPARATRAGR
jgi:secreted trypsin-like serine protease